MNKQTESYRNASTAGIKSQMEPLGYVQEKKGPGDIDAALSALDGCIIGVSGLAPLLEDRFRGVLSGPGPEVDQAGDTRGDSPISNVLWGFVARLESATARIRDISDRSAL